MNELHLEIDENGISIIDNSMNTLYYINKSELTRINKRGHSGLILHLSEKNWITTDILYKIALIIKKELPNKSFNWYETFYIIEKEVFLSSIRDIFNAKKKTLTEETIAEIEFNKSESSDETHTIIDTIVTDKIKEHRL